MIYIYIYMICISIYANISNYVYSNIFYAHMYCIYIFLCIYIYTCEKDAYIVYKCISTQSCGLQEYDTNLLMYIGTFLE